MNYSVAPVIAIPWTRPRFYPQCASTLMWPGTQWSFMALVVIVFVDVSTFYCDFASGLANASFCPHAYGCRNVLVSENQIILDVSDHKLLLTVQVPVDKTLWLVSCIGNTGPTQSNTTQEASWWPKVQIFFSSQQTSMVKHPIHFYLPSREPPSQHGSSWTSMLSQNRGAAHSSDCQQLLHYSRLLGHKFWFVSRLNYEKP